MARFTPAPSLARSTAIMSFGTVLSRVTGVIRLAAMAAALGIAETRLTDAYNLANAVPNVIYELVLGGVITSVFVPLFVELKEKETKERAWEVYSGIINLCLLVLTVIALLGILAAPWIAQFYASRLSGADAAEQARVITFLLRLFIPQVVLYGLYFTVSGVINAHKRFGPPMYTQIVNNLVLIAVFVFFARAYGEVTLAGVTNTQLLVIGLGTTASVAPSGLLLLPYLRRLGRYRPTLSLDHPSVKKLARLSVFVIGFVVANQVGFVVIQWLANAQRGGYSAFISAQTFFLLPIGLFVWSISTALLPAMSEHAVAERWDAYKERLSTGVRALLFLMLPTTVGMLVLARPIVRLLLEHGVATAASTDLVASVLRFFMLGLVQFSIFQLLIRAFYATQDTRSPFLINCVVVAVNIAANVLLFGALEVQGLAVGQAIAYTVGVVLEAAILAGRVGSMDLAALGRGAARSAIAACGMGLAVWLAWTGLERLVAPAAVLAQAVVVGVPVIVGVVVYLGLAHLLEVEELTYLQGLLARRTRS
jgi:putative peptidoglycan lipid II flippase